MAQDREVWLLVDSRGPGGIESHVLQLAFGLRQHHIPVVVVFLSDYGHHPMKDALAELEIRYFCLSHPIRGLWQQVKQHKPRLLHSHGYKAGIIARMIGVLCAVPVISTFHAGEAPAGKMALYDRIDRYTAVLARQCISVSQPISQRLPVSSLMMNNFVRTDNVGLAKGKQLAFVGRLSEEKGPQYMLAIARQLPQYCFHIYGDGPLAAQLQQQAPPNIVFHGQQSDMGTVWPEVGLLIMPSLFEGLPMAALEAMSRGIPVVASDVGALPELIVEDVNGWLLPVMDVAGFVTRIKEWRNMPVAKKKHIRYQARYQIVTRYSPQAVIPQLLTIYQKVGA